METQVKVDLTNFRLETRKWLEENCPISMREPITDAKQLYWGGSKGKFSSEDQEIWFERMLQKKWMKKKDQQLKKEKMYIKWLSRIRLSLILGGKKLWLELIH